MRFENKVVIVTGSSRGIGKATALLFSKEGAKVVITYNKSKEEADHLIKKLKNSIAVKCDVSNEEDIKKMIKITIEKFGKIDILINNAGIVFDMPFSQRTAEHWKKTLEVNLIGSFLCAKYAAPYLKKQKNSSIVNLSSTSGLESFNATSIDYDASKLGIVALTRDLAKEFAPYIRVNSVAPGWVNTDMNKDLPKDYIKNELEKVFLKRFAEPEEIAKVILFLASEDASYINGSNIKIDGGNG